MPLLEIVALLMIGFCSEFVKPFGPVHVYKALIMAGVAERFTDLPTQTVEGDTAAEIPGLVFIETTTLPVMVALQTGRVFEETSTV